MSFDDIIVVIKGRDSNKGSVGRALAGLGIMIIMLAIIFIPVVIVWINTEAKHKAEADLEAEIYNSDLLVIEVTDKINTSNGEYYGGNYYAYVCSFNIKVTNNSTKKISFFDGTMSVENINNQRLASFTVQSIDSLKPGDSNNLTVNVYLTANSNGTELWNTNYGDLNIYFNIYEIHFEGKTKYYHGEDVLINPAKNLEVK